MKKEAQPLCDLIKAQSGEVDKLAESGKYSDMKI